MLQYNIAYRSGELKERTDMALNLLEDCTLCPRECRVDRMKDETGICQTGRKARVGSVQAHFGEEAPLVGTRGSGTIFFSGCSLLCNFCQNWDLSHQASGGEVSDQELAKGMILLQERGCHNINLVTPSHVVPQILEALGVAIGLGLNIPIIYNSSGYDRVSTLKLLDGIIDIYMPDFKFWDPAISLRYCNAEDYPEVAQRAIAEMHRQVGDLRIDEGGIAKRGVLVRHLVLPENLAGTRQVMDFLASEVSGDTYVNIMAQFRPCYMAIKDKQLGRGLKRSEYDKAIDYARNSGIQRLDSDRFFY
jgi:putative pyruvate formate lyase activating enzyme